MLAPGEEVRLEPVGDGNINWVRRARAADGRSWILKQARPALERFPEYETSTERLVFEARYFEIARPLDDAGVCPEILHFDPEQRVLVLADLGEAERLDDALARGADVQHALAVLGRFLGTVHAATRGDALVPRFGNEEMRRLHGDHIFHLPYRENEFPLSPAIAGRAREIWANAEFVSQIDAAYERYLEPRGCLVHADVQPGNVLLHRDGPVLLDAEIAHVGDPGFDPGTLIAHLLLAHVGAGGRSAAQSVSTFWAAYEDAHGAEEWAPFADAARYAGVEMLRRTIGAARVAAVESDEASLAAIDLGTRLAMEPPAGPEGIGRA